MDFDRVSSDRTRVVARPAISTTAPLLLLSFVPTSCSYSLAASEVALSTSLSLPSRLADTPHLPSGYQQTSSLYLSRSLACSRAPTNRSIIHRRPSAPTSIDLDDDPNSFVCFELASVPDTTTRYGVLAFPRVVVLQDGVVAGISNRIDRRAADSASL